MSDKPPVTFHDPNFDLSPIPYVEGYDDPEANVVFICSDRKAIRVHDYYLKAESAFFRDMFEAGTLGGPIGIDEFSSDFAVVLDRVMRKLPAISEWEAGQANLGHLLRLAPITRKYKFESTNALLRRTIARCASHCPPQALGYAMTCDPPDRLIVRSALENFEDQMEGDHLTPFFNVSVWGASSKTGRGVSRHSPHAYNLQWDFVKEKLGVEGYYAYSLALSKSQYGGGGWNWKKVAQVFVEQLELQGVAMTPAEGYGV